MRKSPFVFLTSAFKGTPYMYSQSALRCLFLVAATLLLSTSALAQATGQITGVVSDPTGRVLPSAGIELINSATSQIRNTTSGPDGSFAIPLVNPGTYQVQVSLTGFKTSLTRGIEVVVN